MGLAENSNAFRIKRNEKIMASESLIIKRIFKLETNAYFERHLDLESKKFIGRICSLVLPCNEWVKYHLGKCKEIAFSTEQMQGMGMATSSGGTIVPQLPWAFEYWEEARHHV